MQCIMLRCCLVEYTHASLGISQFKIWQQWGRFNHKSFEECSKAYLCLAQNYPHLQLHYLPNLHLHSLTSLQCTHRYHHRCKDALFVASCRSHQRATAFSVDNSLVISSTCLNKVEGIRYRFRHLHAD
jgi:hypothetical protein